MKILTPRQEDPNPGDQDPGEWPPACAPWRAIVQRSAGSWAPEFLVFLEPALAADLVMGAPKPSENTNYPLLPDLLLHVVRQS